ncbi:MAG: hypothetical protein ACKOPM_10300 [Novosphingobium sp.]
MSIKVLSRSAALGLVLVLGGCEHSMGDKTAAAAKFGDANRMTMAAQVVNPDPQYDQPMTGSAESAAKAVERWRTDRVKKPEKVRSTQVQGGGGSGGN